MSGAPSRALRVLIHAQHLTGIGHWVRSHAIARALAARHVVWLTDGGRPVPLARPDPRVHLLPLPRLHRARGGLAPLARGAGLAATLSARRRALREAAANLRPDVVIVEHYPFSKWELEPEILALLRAARAARPGVRVVCSLRDLAPQTSREPVAPAAHARRVLARLARYFDAVLVHADPRLARLDASFPQADRIPIPVLATGMVVDAPPARPPAASAAPRRPYVLAMVGGGAGDPRFPRRCLAAWASLQRGGPLRGHRLVVLAGLPWSARRRAALARAGGRDVEVRPFAADVTPWLRGAALVVAHAGYNTAARILALRARAVLVPNPRMSDQGPRAARLAALGYAETPPPGPASVAALAGAMRRALARPARAAGPDLDGAAATRRAIEALARGVSPRRRRGARG